MIYFTILLFLTLLLCDLPALIKKRERKQLWIYSVLSIIVLIYMIRYTIGAEIFSPIKSLSVFVRNLGLNYELWQGHS